MPKKSGEKRLCKKIVMQNSMVIKFIKIDGKFPKMEKGAKFSKKLVGHATRKRSEKSEENGGLKISKKTNNSEAYEDFQ